MEVIFGSASIAALTWLGINLSPGWESFWEGVLQRVVYVAGPFWPKSGQALSAVHSQTQFLLTVPAQGLSAVQTPFHFNFPAPRLRNKDSDLLAPAEKRGKEE